MPDKGHSIFTEKSWWGRRTKFEKILLIITTLIIVSSVFIVVFGLKKLSSIHKDTNVCQNDGCILTAARLIQNMNRKVDPCDDFYEFACGGYTENTQIPDDETSITTFDEAHKRIEENMRMILEKPIDENELTPFKQTKKLYRMCMNSTETDEAEFKLFKKMLKDLGGWPVLEGNYWNEKDFDWRETQYNFRKMGHYNTQFISMYIGLDPKNSTKRIFTIDQTCGGFSKILKKGFNDTLVKTYYNYLVDMAILYGADKLQASKDMKQYMDFRIELAKIITPSEERRNASLEYNPMTIRELQLNYPSISWLQYINSKLEPYVTLTYDDVVIVNIPKYLEKLEKLMSHTPKRAIANYLFVSITEDYHFNDEMRKKRLEFSKVFIGVTEEPPKWKQCIHSGLYLARSAMYVRQYLKNKSKYVVTELITDIKSTFIENLKKSTWMDSKTKKRAIQKAEEMGSFIGYPDEILDDEEIEKHYEGLTINEESIIKTSLALSIWSRNKYLKEYYKPYNKKDWKNKAYPTVVNAFYSFLENNIVLPTGILHQPFFDFERPKYLNYGAIGYIIGHEIIHGFDDEGRQYDKDGNLADWWEPAANKSFQEKAQCIIDQYANYTQQKINMSLNGVNTQGENIADNGGIKMAYLAYQKWLQRNKPEPKLPGLPYTPQQLFWISAATDWCAKIRPEMEKLMILNDFHSPNYYRTIIPFINSGFFAKDFNCPLGSKMNPKHKCRLW